MLVTGDIIKQYLVNYTKISLFFTLLEAIPLAKMHKNNTGDLWKNIFGLQILLYEEITLIHTQRVHKARILLRT